MTLPPTHVWLNALLLGLQSVQAALLWGLHALGIAGDSHGAPAWPWNVRIAGENLVIDVALARQFAWMLAALAFALVCVLIAIGWRRARRWALAAAIAALVFAPWPSPSLWLTAAVPTSFHPNPSGFTVESIARGSHVYTAQCAACHGADGRGEGPQAAALRRWPPTMASALLSRRADGELFWHVLYGMRDDAGVTMPGFAGRLSDKEIWAALDYMRVLSASAGMAAGGSWPVPIALPALTVKCGDTPARSLAQWRGTQRVRVVAVDARHPPPFEDPRFLTLLIRRDETGVFDTRLKASPGLASGVRRVSAPLADGLRASARPALSTALATVTAPTAPSARTTTLGARADCLADSPDAWPVFAQIAGTSEADLAGTEWLADRDGWLRALAPAGKRGWADGGLLCTTSTAAASLPASAARDPLTDTLRQMDGEPVRFIKGGFVH
ncbi:Cytochrome c6 [Pandoraea pneumonica]|uniref:Cytochrome c6 n=1 Tax=Pandoraea pneumonica TaxID=2508299 RepID=A0A5E4YCT3_9BURK|nr:cytochrome c [Pandoraea pneumonica]VVE45973.1 Cytochrome c6 [Pandoraea pneumonica]